MPQEGNRPVLRFGVFEANLPAQELRKHGTRVRLRGQSFCILSMLLEKPGGGHPERNAAEVVARRHLRRL